MQHPTSADIQRVRMIGSELKAAVVDLVFCKMVM